MGPGLPLTQRSIGRRAPGIAEQKPCIRHHLIHSEWDIDEEGAHKPGVGAGAHFHYLSPITHTSVPRQVPRCHADVNQNGGYTRSKPLNPPFVCHADFLMLEVPFRREMDLFCYGDALW